MAMREIIFRGKRLDSGTWVEGDLSQGEKSSRINTHENGQPWLGYAVDPSTIGQYTGMTDKAGTKAFEHDCIFDPSENAVGVIRYGKYKNPLNGGCRSCHIGFYVDWISGECKEIFRKDLGYWLNYLEVIGNIHGNPELLELGVHKMAEVGLIDANALIADKDNYVSSIWGDAITVQDIGDAPTIEAEPVRHGRWEWYEEPITSLRPDPDYGWRCCHCKEDVVAIIQRASPASYVEFDNIDVPPKFDYCPNCGAKMDDEEGEHD